MLTTPIMRSSETLLTPRPANKAKRTTRPILSEQEQPSEPQPTSKQLFRWSLTLGVSLAFVSSSYSALQSLLSSLFVETGIGVKSLVFIYSAAAISSIYSQFLVERLTPNWVVVASFVITSLYIAVYFYPRIYIVGAAAVLLGLFTSPLQCACNSFIAHVACKTTSVETRQSAIRHHFGRFAVFINSGQVWGNLVTSLLLHYGDQVYAYPTKPKQPQPFAILPQDMASPSLSRTLVSSTLCDADQCKRWGIVRNSAQFAFILPSNVSLMLVSVYLGLAFVGVALATTLLDKLEIQDDEGGRSSFANLVKRYFLCFVDPQLRLMYPLAFFGGLQQGFVVADFSKSYVSCSLGMESVGYTMMTMGLTHTLGSLAVYHVSAYFKRLIIMLMGLSFHGGMLAVLWLWRPAREDIAVFYIVASGWGVCSAVWETLTITFVVTVSINDLQPSLLAHFTVRCIGLAVAFLSSFYLCTEIKLYVLAALLVSSVISFIFLEYRLHQQHKSQGRTAVL